MRAADAGTAKAISVEGMARELASRSPGGALSAHLDETSAEYPVSFPAERPSGREGKGIQLNASALDPLTFAAGKILLAARRG